MEKKEILIVEVLLSLGNGLYRQATPEEIKEDKWPPMVWGSIVLRADGTYVQLDWDGLGR